MHTKTKYNISDSFYRRYFEQNALNRFGMEALKFIWFKEGKFLNPMKKEQIIHEYIEEEIENFFENNILNIPQIEFAITTRCSLRCKDCNALIPRFNQHGHIEMNFENFKTNLDKLLSSVNIIRHFCILGGEPLLHKELAKMLEYTLLQDKIYIVRLITNGTLLPDEEVMNVAKKYHKKVYFYISNYSANKALHKRLKHNELKELLTKNNIKFQIVGSPEWNIEACFATNKFSKDQVLDNFQSCTRTQCVQLLNSKIDICSKASTAREIGLLNITDYIDLNTTKDLKSDLIQFYKKPYQEACEYCVFSMDTVEPALQIVND